MPTFADLEKPPFYTAIFMTALDGEDQGLHSEAAATMVSTAMLLSGFVGFADDVAEFGRPVKLVYWRTFHAMRAWHRTARDLLPHRVDIRDCIASEGCHWRWFDERRSEPMTAMRDVA
ncbi:MAG: hypothetical protein VW338_10675 [Rhodospirillaceae bacterium]